MNLFYMLEKLREESKGIENCLKVIPTKNIKTEKAIVESLTKLAYFLFVNDENNDVILICDELSKIEFKNDYDYWTWVEYALALRAEISEQNGNKIKQVESVRLIEDALISGEGLPKKIRGNVHKRFMDGEGVALNSNEEEEGLDARLIYLMRLIKLKSLGGSEKYTLVKASVNIIENKKIMKGMFETKAKGISLLFK
ncbi:DUF6707 family protein [Pantoea sp. FN0307]|uniref:DUF6707 family protein n=1 Tax=Pantoea sp. FN0307 TaxID=3418560 RepID=UPI003CF613DB